MASNPVSVKSRPLTPKKLREVYEVLHARFGNQRWWPGETPFEVIIGAILTQNTAWTNVEKAILNLKIAGKLTPLGLRELKVEELAQLIRPAGYFNVKAKRLKHFIRFFFENYDGNLSKMKKEPGDVLRAKLLEVNGIGPETADSIMLYALGKPFFVIDAYTKRIFSRHRLANTFEDYAAWQDLFMRSLPRDLSLYNDYHAQIVRLAKEHCRASIALCETCPLNPYL